MAPFCEQVIAVTSDTLSFSRFCGMGLTGAGLAVTARPMGVRQLRPASGMAQIYTFRWGGRRAAGRTGFVALKHASGSGWRPLQHVCACACLIVHGCAARRKLIR